MNTKRNTRFVSVLLCFTLVLSMALVAFTAFSFSASASTSDTLVTITDLNMRKSASTSSTVLTTVPKGKSVELLENSSSGWAKVKYSSFTGYCSTYYLDLAEGTTATMSGKTTSELNLRSGKGTSYSVLTVIPSSKTVTVLSNADEDWAKVTYSSKTGYVSKEYLTLSFKLGTVTPTEPSTEPESSTKPDYSNIPKWYSHSLTDSILSHDNVIYSSLMLNSRDVTVDTNGTFKLTAFVSGGAPVNEYISFESNDTSVVKVTDKGLVTGVKHGTAYVTATNLVTLSSVKCKVTVSDKVLPTETPSEKPTTPTQPPTTPTEKPTEATEPTEKPTEKPTTATETLELLESDLRLYVGTQHILKAVSNTDIKWSSSDSSIVSVDNGLLTIKSAGEATITAKTSKKSATCKVTALTQKIDVNSSHSSATVTAGKTFFARSTTEGVTWSSSDTSIATVNDGFILGVSEGQAIIKIYKKGGTKTILVTVTKPDPIRFAYASPNCAPKNSDVKLIAITDKSRTDVRFKVTDSGATNTVYASNKKTEGSTYVWEATYKFTESGTFNVKAYSKLGSSWTTCDDAVTTAFVAETTDLETTALVQRRVSDGLINMIAGFEGYMPSVYYDSFTGDPTLGYGKLVYVGEQFYNSLTKSEAYAYLAQTINNEGYSSKVNSFFISNNVKFNQQQLDALVCFVYNTGTGVLSNDSELKSALLDCPAESSSGTKTYYINGSGVRIRKGPGTSYDIIDELSYGTTLKILEKTSSSWYYVQLSDGTKGYVATDYIASKTVSSTLDLNYVNKQNLINKMCQYHHAGGCIRGLLNRRIDEMEIFFYNDYDIDYGSNNYNIKFTCANNPSFSA